MPMIHSIFLPRVLPLFSTHPDGDDIEDEYDDAEQAAYHVHFISGLNVKVPKTFPFFGTMLFARYLACGLLLRRCLGFFRRLGRPCGPRRTRTFTGRRKLLR